MINNPRGFLVEVIITVALSVLVMAAVIALHMMGEVSGMEAALWLLIAALIAWSGR